MSNSKCCVPGCFKSEGSSKVLHKFPNPAKYRDLLNTWIHAIGGEILRLENEHIFKYRRVCQRHFDEMYWCRNNRLSNIAVPTKHMPGTHSYEGGTSETYTAADQRIFDTDQMEDTKNESKNEHSDGNDVGCIDIEYLDDAVTDVSDDDNDDITRPGDDTNPLHDDTATPTKALFEQNFKLTLDDIDYLFLSYAKTFRSLAKQFQTMLKLDMAKLFARYEMKNTSSSTQEASTTNLLPGLRPSEPVRLPLPYVNPIPQAVKPSQEKKSIFVPSKEENKRIFRRVPLQAVIAGTYKANTVESIPPVVQRAQAVRQQIISPQIIHSEDLEVNTKQKRPISDTKPSKDTTSNLEIQKPYPPNKFVKYYTPKRGPAYAIVSKNSVQAQEMLPNPELVMDVSGPVPTETVFVPTDLVNFSEDET